MLQSTLNQRLKSIFINLDYLDDIRNYENIDLSIINFSYIKLNHMSFSSLKKKMQIIISY